MSLSLELVLGMTSCNAAGLTADASSSLVAYPASGILVILDTQTNIQVSYLILERNLFTCSSFVKGGQLIVTGERGLKPAVRIWTVQDGVELRAFYGHDYGIRVVRFSPTGNTIVSVGLEHDNLINVWAWPSGFLRATNTCLDHVMNIAYSEDGSYFVTVGRRCIKFWYPSRSVSKEAELEGTAMPLYGRPAILSNCKDNIFMDVDCGNGATRDFVFATSHSGCLAILQASMRKLMETIFLDHGQVTCLKCCDSYLYLGLDNGEVNIINSQTLETMAVLPQPNVDPNLQVNTCARCLVFNDLVKTITIVYANMSMSVYDMSSFDNPKHRVTCVFHQDFISGLGMLAAKCQEGHEVLVTSSHDSTVRMWGMMTTEVLGSEGLTVLFLKKPFTEMALCDPDSIPSSEANECITSMQVIPQGERIVLGTKEGHVYVYQGWFFLFERFLRPHRNEVTCLTYIMTNDRCLVASGSRDRVIQVMDASKDFRLLSTLNVHSSSISMIQFSLCPGSQAVRLISCGLDRTLNLCVCKDPNAEYVEFHLQGSAKKVASPIDMAMDKTLSRLAVACQDGFISVCNAGNLDELCSYRGCVDNLAQLHRVILSPSGKVLVTASSDRLINLLDFNTGLVLGTFSGSNDRVTSMVFSGDGRYLISTSTSGCLFAWRFKESPARVTKSTSPWMSMSLRDHLPDKARCLEQQEAHDCLDAGEKNGPRKNTADEKRPILKVKFSSAPVQRGQKYGPQHLKGPFEQHCPTYDRFMKDNVVKDRSKSQGNMHVRSISLGRCRKPDPMDVNSILISSNGGMRTKSMSTPKKDVRDLESASVKCNKMSSLVDLIKDRLVSKLDAKVKKSKSTAEKTWAEGQKYSQLKDGVIMAERLKSMVAKTVKKSVSGTYCDMKTAASPNQPLMTLTKEYKTPEQMDVSRPAECPSQPQMTPTKKDKTLEQMNVSRLAECPNQPQMTLTKEDKTAKQIDVSRPAQRPNQPQPIRRTSQVSMSAKEWAKVPQTTSVSIKTSASEDIVADVAKGNPPNDNQLPLIEQTCKDTFRACRSNGALIRMKLSLLRESSHQDVQHDCVCVSSLYKQQADGDVTLTKEDKTPEQMDVSRPVAMHATPSLNPK